MHRLINFETLRGKYSCACFRNVYLNEFKIELYMYVLNRFRMASSIFFLCERIQILQRVIEKFTLKIFSHKTGMNANNK